MTTYLNLLPFGYRRKQLILLRLRHWSGLWVLALAATALIGWTQWSAFRRGLVRLDSLRREYAPVKQTSEEAEQIRQVIQDLQQREALVLELADEQSTLTLMGLLSRAARACEGRVSIQDLILQRQENDEGVVKVLTIRGIAVDNQAVASFASALRDSNAFQRVELRNTGITRSNDLELRTYSLECAF